jgi:hypothetical protein
MPDENGKKRWILEKEKKVTKVIKQFEDIVKLSEVEEEIKNIESEESDARPTDNA